METTRSIVNNTVAGIINPIIGLMKNRSSTASDNVLMPTDDNEHLFRQSSSQGQCESQEKWAEEVGGTVTEVFTDPAFGITYKHRRFATETTDEKPASYRRDPRGRGFNGSLMGQMIPDNHTPTEKESSTASNKKPAFTSSDGKSSRPFILPPLNHPTLQTLPSALLSATRPRVLNLDQECARAKTTTKSSAAQPQKIAPHSQATYKVDATKEKNVGLTRLRNHPNENIRKFASLDRNEGVIAGKSGEKTNVPVKSRKGKEIEKTSRPRRRHSTPGRKPRIPPTVMEEEEEDEDVEVGKVVT